MPAIKPVTKKLQIQRLQSFLDTGQHTVSRRISYAGLGLGVWLLLCSVQLYLNIHQVLQEKSPRQSGYDYISITKTVTNQNMGRDNRFQASDLDSIRKQPFIEEAAPLNSNQFRAKASAGNIIPFSTDLFLESIDHRFLDTVPPDFTWAPGQQFLPIIFSSDYLEVYNVFAPAQDLPQLSPESLGSLQIQVECFGPNGMEVFTGRIVALTDRINSVLVPDAFLQWANLHFGGSGQVPAARVYIKTKDANQPELLQYLESKQYRVNKDKTKFGRIKQVLNLVASGLGIFAVLVIVLAMMLYAFYLQLVIARSKDNLLRLMQLGYSPGILSETVTRSSVPVQLAITLFALLAASLVQWGIHHYSLNGQVTLQPWLHPMVWVLALLIVTTGIVYNRRMVKRMLNQL